jgi:mitochondrial fission process protein 1
MSKKDDWDPQVPHERKEERPDFTKLPEYKKLPESIQRTIDDEDKLWDTLYDGT